MALGRILDTSSTGAVAAVLLAVLLAGCSDGGGEAPPVDGGDGARQPTSTAPEGTGNVAGGAGGDAALAPAWQVGQWWTWRLEAAAAPGPLEATTVVLAGDSASYSVGATDAAAAAQVYPFHLVGFGAVARDTLAWQAHGLPVQFLRFPIVDGDSWTADFWSAPGATVTVRSATVQGPDGPEPGYRSEATYAGGGLFAAASWSLARGQFVQVQSYFGGTEPFASATLTAEGQDGKEARPFEATDILRLSSSPSAPQSAAPVEVAVPAEADLVLMACFLGGGPGVFQAVLDYGEPPARNCVANTADSSLHYVAFTLPAAGGTGRLAVAPAGQGSVTVELFGVATGG